jgi:hypothetical protein
MTKSDFELMTLALRSLDFATGSGKSSLESQEQIAAAEQQTVAQPVVGREPGWGI